MSITHTVHRRSEGSSLKAQVYIVQKIDFLIIDG